MSAAGRRRTGRGARARALPAVIAAAGLLCVSSVAVRSVAAGAANPRASEAAPAPHAVFPGASLLALADDRLLVWEAHGRAQLRGADGVWTDVFQLPVGGILRAEPDGAGFLVAGSTGPGPGHSFAVLFSAAGHELRRWPLPPDGAFWVAVDQRGRWAATREGMVPLRDDGTIGPREPYPAEAGNHLVPPRVMTLDGAKLFCRGADLSMERNAPGLCQRLGDGGWRFEGTFVESPLVCGPWLIARDGPRDKGITIRSLATGKLAGRSSYRVRPSMACAAPDQLLVGERGLSLLRLPSAKPAWKHPAAPAGAAIADVAIAKTFIAYRADGSLDVRVLPRPTP